MILRSNDLYGIECESLEMARTVIEASLNIVMIAHESIFYCGDYYLWNDVSKEHIILQYNYDEFHEEWTEEGYSKYSFLLYVNETLRSSEVASLLQKDKRIVSLKHQEL